MDEARTSLTRSWLTKANNDLKNARIVSEAPDGPLDTAIYHCQQAGEKAVKAFLISHDVPFPKTHEIGTLVEQAITLDARFKPLLESAELLSPYAWQFRYPSETTPSDPTRAEFDGALHHAQAIYDLVLKILSSEETGPVSGFSTLSK
jgi:HEPN domain-containing protein